MRGMSVDAFYNTRHRHDFLPKAADWGPVGASTSWDLPMALAPKAMSTTHAARSCSHFGAGAIISHRRRRRKRRSARHGLCVGGYGVGIRMPPSAGRCRREGTPGRSSGQWPCWRWASTRTPSRRRQCHPDASACTCIIGPLVAHAKKVACDGLGSGSGREAPRRNDAGIPLHAMRVLHASLCFHCEPSACISFRPPRMMAAPAAAPAFG